jgi:Cullin family
MLSRFNQKIKRALLDEFKKERDHDNCDTDLIQSSFRMYFEVDYEQHSKLNMANKKLQYAFSGEPEDQVITFFEKNMTESLLEETGDYYARKLEEWLVLPVPDFLDIANTFLKEEDLRIQRYYNELRQRVWKTLTDSIIVKSNNLITKNEKSGLFQLLIQENLKYVKILYEFLTVIKTELHNFTAYALNYIRHKISDFKKEFEDEGENEDEIKLIEKLSQFRKSMIDICNDCFQGNKQIIGSVKLELQSEFSRVTDFPKMLAGYMDDFIVKNGKNQESEEVQEQTNNIFEMVNLTAERVNLLHYYEQTLKSRLLSVSNYYESMENEFLKRITQIMGE